MLIFPYLTYGKVGMALHLVGETTDKDRSHYGAETGKLVKLVRGIYVDVDDDVDVTVLKHAVRIARYLYPKTYLAAGSAIQLGPMRDGRLFISGRRIQRTRIRALEIVQNQAPPHPALDTAIIDDGAGKFRVHVSSLRQRLLEAFRLRSEHAASIDEAGREALMKRLIEEYGSPQAVADALWTLARQNEWYREGELAERFLLRRPVAPARNEAQIDLIVACHGEPIGNLRHDGFEWRWTPTDNGGPSLVRQTTPGKLPPFISSLMPEGWLEAVLKDPDERAALRSGKRYMSNVTIVERLSELASLPSDMLTTRLADYTIDGFFTGVYAGPGCGDIEQTFEQHLARLYEQEDTPRLSGVQIKAPMYLDAAGTLTSSTGKPFTHILKPGGARGFEPLPVIEWLAMSLGREAGFLVPDAALVAMPGGLAPALIVERFDIRTGVEDRRLIALEDLCSAMDLPASAKYTGSIERAARAIRPLSTSPDEDLLILFRRALFAWLIADGDMHLKNMALLKIAAQGGKQFQEVRMSPLYDAVTTRVFPRLESDRMALKLNGKDDRLRRADFRAMAATMGLKAAEADKAIADMGTRLERSIGQIKLSEVLVYTPETKSMTQRLIEIVQERLTTIA
jgi:serine/threonine-protein kinase HipA